MLLPLGIGLTDSDAPTRAVNQLSQTIETVACWGIAAIVIVWAIRMSRQRRSFVPVSIILAAAVNSFNEPLFDNAYHLFWYAPGQWTLFSTFGYPQPVWVMGAYIIVYCTPALFIMTRLEQGASRQFLFKAVAVVALLVATWESAAIFAGTYTYYGPHPFRLVGQYPAWLGLMEAAHIGVWSVLLAKVGPRLRRWNSLLVVPLFSIAFCSVMYGAGMPGLAVINARGVDIPVRYLGAVASMALACTMVWLAGQLVRSAKPDGGSVETALREWITNPRASLVTTS